MVAGHSVHQKKVSRNLHDTFFWVELGRRDLNPDKQNQNLLSYQLHHGPIGYGSS